MKIEIWKDVEGFEGLYQISNFGRIKRIIDKQRERISYGSNCGSYLSVVFCVNGKIVMRKLVHDLVVETFIRKFDTTKEQCHHIDHNTKNNKLQNLQILSKTEHKHDPITRQKISNSLKGRKRSPETIAKIQKNRKYSQEKRIEQRIRANKIKDPITGKWTKNLQ